MEKTARAWTKEEQESLFDSYFSSSPDICPVCSSEVSMVMSYLGRTVTLLLCCEGCDNKAHVNGPRPVWRNVHRTGEVESRCA
jgi:hypothetical protein